MPVEWMSRFAGTPIGEHAKPRGTAKRRVAAKRARKARRKSR